MRFGVLGPLAVWTDAGEVVPVPGRKVRALLTDLLVHEGRLVSADRLVDDVWGESPPADAAAALHVRVSQLRRALADAEPGGRELVLSQPPGYALRAGPGTVDALRFAALTVQARAAADPRARAGLLGEALGLWRGPALADFADEEFAQAAVARWEEQRLAAVEAYAETRLDLGEHGELVGELGEQVTQHPYRERLRAAHMRALYRAGRAADALDSFQELRHRLADELGLDPGPEVAALHRAILAGDPAEDPPPASAHPPARRPVTNLPAMVTELVGRDYAVAQVRELLAAGRLVTVTGPGGVGKTSAAVAAARSLVETYPDGVWLVDLTTLARVAGGPASPADQPADDPADQAELAELVLSVLSVPDAPGGGAGDRLAGVLRDQRLLLVLDNCEHVIAPVAGLVGRLLAAAPELRVVTTSREPLRLRGEARVDLSPLDVPDTDDPDRLARSPAVQLFRTRAGLASDQRTIAGVAEICRRLDGIPLALELAATRVPALGVPELAARLRVPQDRFGLLGSGHRDAPARQRTLAAVIDWSWRLLSGPEQAALRRLAVHSGGCTLAAAEAVCGGEGVRPGEVLDLLAGLVDRSLVLRVERAGSGGPEGGGPRFRLLESVSAYCLARLRDADEEAALRRRHAEHYLALAEQAAPQLRGPGQREWLRRLDAEAANLRASLDTFGRAGAAGPALRLAVALTWYWYLRGRFTEARRALTAALAVPGSTPGPARAAARAWQAGLAILQGEAGPERAAEALREFAAVGDPVEQARGEWFVAMATVDRGDQDATAELLDTSLKTFRDEGDRWGEAAALSTRAMLAHMRADPAALERDARRSAELFGEVGDDWGVLQATDWLVGLADLTGEHAEAVRISRDGLRLAEELELWSDVAGRLSWLAWLSVQDGEYPGAIAYAEQALRIAAGQGHRAGEVFARIGLAYAARREGKLDLAEQHLRWLLATAREQQTGTGHPPYLLMVLVELGLLAGQRGDPEAALGWHQQAFEVCREQGSARGAAWVLVGMAAALVADGRPDLAAQLLGAADAAGRAGGVPLSATDRDERERITAAARVATDDFDQQFARGARLTPEQARSRLDRDRA